MALFDLVPPSLTWTPVAATDSPTTTSTTDVLMTGMTVTPIAGQYLVLFNTTITSSAAGAAISYSMYVGGTQIANSLRKIAPFDGGTLSQTSARGAASLSELVTVDGTQAIEIRWSISSGTATGGPRTLIAVKIG